MDPVRLLESGFGLLVLAGGAFLLVAAKKWYWKALGVILAISGLSSALQILR